jgi:hypothetical protein
VIKVFARLLDAKQANERCLSGRRVFSRRLADICCRSFRVEQVIADLERDAEIFAISFKRGSVFSARLCLRSRPSRTQP